MTQTGIQDFCQTVPYNSTISITNIVYRTGYQYNNYSLTSGNQVISSNSNSITFKFTNAADSSLSWNTKPIKYNFSVTSQKTKYGTVSGPSGSIDFNSSVTIKATAVTNYIFSGWIDESGKTVSTSATYTFNMPAKNYSLKATFTFDINSISNINVLNVYPNSSYANYVQTWMNSYGMGKITVTPLAIESFNANPAGYLGSSGNWKYDVIIYGFADSNASKDISASAATVTRQFYNEGNGVIFGHDTLNRPNFKTLCDLVNITISSGNGAAATSVSIVKEGIFTTYPYKIGNVGTKLTVPATHVSSQFASGDIWLKLENGVSGNGNFYLTTYKNGAMIQTGHSNGAATADEQKIIANLVFYMYSYSKMNDI